MYAIINTGGKQFKAAKDETIVVEKIDGEPGSKIDLDSVVMVVDKGDGGDRVLVLVPFLTDQTVPNQVADRLRAIGVVALFDQAIELHEQMTVE